MKEFFIILVAYLGFVCIGHAQQNFTMKVEQIYNKSGDEKAWKNLTEAPRDWQIFDGQVPSDGKPYWVFIKFKIDGEYSEGLQTFLMHMRVSSAYQLYWDGVLVNDLIGTKDIREADLSVPFYSFVVLSADQISSGEHIAVMRMNGSNKQESVIIDFDAEDYSKSGFERFWWVGSILLLLSVSFITALYFFTLFVSISGGYKPLIGALLCVSVLLITLLDNSDWLFSIPYQVKWIFDGALTVSSMSLFILLPLYLCLVFSVEQIWKVMFGVIILFVVSFVPNDLFREHDVRAFSYLLIFCAGLSFFHYKSHSNKAIFIGAGILLCSLVFQVDEILKHLMLLVLIMIFAVELAADLWARQKQKHRLELNAARLQAELLKRNIQPHFIMNSLTAVMEWIETDPDMGLKFIEELANEFRLLAMFANKKFVSISDEIELCRIHLRLMSMRLGENYKIEVDQVDPGKMIPPVIFHTLIENAISHNKFSNPDGDVIFTLSSEENRNYVSYHFKVPYQPKEREVKGSGTGMSYIKARLEEAFPAGWSINDQCDGEYWRTDIYVSNGKL